MAEAEQLMSIVVTDPLDIGQCGDALRTRMHQFGITVTEHLRRSDALAFNRHSAASASGLSGETRRDRSKAEIAAA